MDRSSLRLLAAALVLAIPFGLAACASDEAAPPVEPLPASLAQLTGPWQAVPLRLDPITWGKIEAVCRQDMEFPPGAQALHMDVRGAGVAIVRMTGAQSGICYALQITPGGQVNGAGPGMRSDASEHWKVPAGTALGPVDQQTVEGGDLKVAGWSVSGPAGAGIASVIVQPVGAPQIVATVGNGWFSAWWPAQAAPNAPLGGGIRPNLPAPPPYRIQGFDANGTLVNQIGS